MNRLMALIGALVLAVAACGGGGDDAATGDLPPNNDGGTQALGSTCLAGESDCNDIPGASEPQELPDSEDTSTNGMAVDGGLTVAEALATDATGVLAVKGFVVADGDEVRLCDALLESYPPQCGGDSVVLDSLEVVDPDALTAEGAVTWTDSPQTVFGELADGLLTTTALSQ